MWKNKQQRQDEGEITLALSLTMCETPGPVGGEVVKA